jgi:hypothetical protein
MQQQLTTPREFIERRRHHRHRFSTFATLSGGGARQVRCWVRDISTGGALLLGSERLEVGATYAAHLHLPWTGSVRLPVRVEREQPDRGGARAYGVAFDGAPRPALARILDTLLSAQAAAGHRGATTVLVVTRQDGLEEELARDLERIGVRWVLARTPLDLVLWLHHRRITIGAVLVDHAFNQEVLFPLLGFLASEHPGVRRVIVSDGPFLPRRGAVARAGRASAVLNSPWDCHQLEQALAS